MGLGICGIEIRLRAQDAQSGGYIGNPTVQATVACRSDVLVTVTTSPTDTTGRAGPATLWPTGPGRRTFAG